MKYCLYIQLIMEDYPWQSRRPKHQKNQLRTSC
nr:MAG TPA: hypothetical protein [Bacteriophage sp.]